MLFSRILANPLTGATVLVAMALAWSFAFADAKSHAAQAAKSTSAWSAMSAAQMEDVGACEQSALAKAHAPPTGADKDTAAEKLAYDCAANYLLSQSQASSAAAAQIFGHAAAAAMRESAMGREAPKFARIDDLYAKTAKDAAEATVRAEQADRALGAYCDSMLASLACDAGGFTPDRAERKLADPLREFELDLHAQFWNATHAAQANQAKSAPDHSAQNDPAYAFARKAILARNKT